jgi:cell division protein FtsA
MGTRYLLGLDIGTTKACAVVARANESGAEIIGAGLAPSRGMKKGVVVDMDAMAETIRKAVDMAEESSGVELRAAYIGIAGGHIECQDSYGATGIKGKEVTRKDIERVVESASTIYVPLERELLHVLPSDFIIDGQAEIVQPLGMSGVRLEANVCVITASQAAHENLLRCVRAAGIEVIETVFEPIASSRAVLRPYEMEYGTAVVDIGGGTTDLAVFVDGRLRHASALPVGGNHLTNDIAIGLRLSPEEAERVKLLYGYAVGGEGQGEMEVTCLDGVRRKMQRRYLGEIILPRCEEIFEMMADEVRRALVFSPSPCVVLTGGTSLLEGIDRVAEAKLSLPVRVGLPENGMSVARKEILSSPVYSTSVGLMLHGLEAERGMYDDLLLGLKERFGSLKRKLFGFSGPRRFVNTEFRT